MKRKFDFCTTGITDKFQTSRYARGFVFLVEPSADSLLNDFFFLM